MKKINVIGLGAGDLDQMPLGIYRHIKKEDVIYVRTKDHPAVVELEAEGVSFISFDDVYKQHDHFEVVYETIVEKLLKKAEENKTITYAVPGHPLVAEKTIQLLLQERSKETVELEFLGGQSFLDAMYTSLQIDPIEGCQIVDGTSLKG